MKIKVQENNDIEEDEIIINCKKIDQDIQIIIDFIKTIDNKLIGVKDDKTFLIKLKDIFYFESVDKKSFVYTKDDVFEITLRLYQIEELNNNNFFRASKSTIINISKIKELNPVISGKIKVTLDNNEHLLVSRQYVPILKKILGTGR